ncbi:hypothetical protein RJ639_016887 [Escallonia herrerae]|uniref:Transmembrane protein n=1 Tax=Escallonia herrerae TaxID=1293975 RepID=A0AA89ALL1_9ASTE|nr:hypothetical protein RJ639_016887 [Escallonia herrerae]
MSTDVAMVPAGEGSSAAGPSSSSKKPKRFEIKKWNAILLSTTVLSAGIILWISASSAKPIRRARPVRSARSLGVCAITLSISIASVDGLKPVKCVHLITVSGSFRNMVTRVWSLSSGTALGLLFLFRWQLVE